MLPAVSTQALQLLLITPGHSRPLPQGRTVTAKCSRRPARITHHFVDSAAHTSANTADQAPNHTTQHHQRHKADYIDLPTTPCDAHMQHLDRHKLPQIHPRHTSGCTDPPALANTHLYATSQLLKCAVTASGHEKTNALPDVWGHQPRHHHRLNPVT
jgi:hypothetical protein